MSTNVQFTVRVSITSRQEGDWIVAGSPDLDVYSQGRTHDEARRNLVEAIQCFLISCYERGVLDDALKDRGFQKAISDGTDEDNKEHLSVPISLLAGGHEQKINAR